MSQLSKVKLLSLESNKESKLLSYFFCPKSVMTTNKLSYWSITQYSAVLIFISINFHIWIVDRYCSTSKNMIYSNIICSIITVKCFRLDCLNICCNQKESWFILIYASSYTSFLFMMVIISSSLGAKSNKSSFNG